MSLNYDYKKYKFPSGEKIMPRFWNQKKQEVRSNYPFAAEQNERLRNRAAALTDAINKILKDGEPVDRATLAQMISQNVPVETPLFIVKSDFFRFIDTFIDDSASGKRLINGQKLSIYTIKGYKVTRNHLLEFQKKSRRKITFDTLNNAFYDDFVNYFYEKVIYTEVDEQGNTCSQTKGHTINSVGKHIKNLKVFAADAIEKGIYVNPELSRKRFRVLSEDTDQIALSIQDLDKIFSLGLSPDSGLENARDCFILAAYTGLRFSDLKQLNETNFIDGNRLRVTTQKTDQKVIIPLHRVVLAILKKRNGIPPAAISNQKMNKYIKEVGKLAELNELVTVSKTRAGQKEVRTLPKYSLITVHTARRSFATNLYLAGMDTLTIKKMTGHHTEKSFLKYIRVSEEENASRAALHAFFN
jgi:integrase